MKRLFTLASVALIALSMAACGNSSVDNDGTGQVKRIHEVTPIICPSRTDIDVSLGVMRGGVGSMSTQDLWLTVNDPLLLAPLKAANAAGAVVHITYDEPRLVFCQQEYTLTSVTVEK